MLKAEDLKKTISEQIASALRIKILKGEYADGEHLNEVRIAEAYGVSRGPVRDAVKTLEKEGLAVTPRNGRTVARAFSKQDFLDYHRLRLYLEQDAIATILRAAPTDAHYDTWIKVLGSYISAMEHSINPYHETLFNENDYRFHYALMQKANNRITLNVWESYNGLRAAIMVVNSQYLSYEKVVDTIFEPHLAMFRCLSSRDLRGALDSAKKHIDNSIRIYEAAYK